MPDLLRLALKYLTAEKGKYILEEANHSHKRRVATLCLGVDAHHRCDYVVKPTNKFYNLSKLLTRPSPKYMGGTVSRRGRGVMWDSHL